MRDPADDGLVALVWDDLQCLLALRRAGSIGAAARALKIDPSTVSRRLAALEGALGVQLVTRTPEGVKFNDAGMLAAEAAEAIDARIAQLATSIGGSDARPEGTVRVSVTDGFADVMYRGLAKLREEHPRICVELVIGSAAVDLARGEADVAVRLFRETSGDLLTRKVGVLGWSLYASPAYIERKGTPTETNLDEHEIVGFSSAAARSPGARWLEANAKNAPVVMRATTATGALRAAKAGMGVAMLPCFMTANEPSLVRLTNVIAETEAFLVTTQDNKSTTRVRIVMDALVRLFEDERSLLSGSS